MNAGGGLRCRSVRADRHRPGWGPLGL